MAVLRNHVNITVVPQTSKSWLIYLRSVSTHSSFSNEFRATKLHFIVCDDLPVLLRTDDLSVHLAEGWRLVYSGTVMFLRVFRGCSWVWNFHFYKCHYLSLSLQIDCPSVSRSNTVAAVILHAKSMFNVKIRTCKEDPKYHPVETQNFTRSVSAMPWSSLLCRDAMNQFADTTLEMHH